MIQQVSGSGMETEKKVSRDMTNIYANVRKKWFVYDLLILILCQ